MVSNLIAYVGCKVDVIGTNLFDDKKIFFMGTLESIGPESIIVDTQIYYLENEFYKIDEILVDNVDIFKRNTKTR